MSLSKAVIVYLTRSDEKDVHDLVKSLRLLKKNFLNRFPYPVIVFIESSFRKDWKEFIWKSSGVRCHFETVEFRVPHFLDPHKVPLYVFHPKFTVGYRHMCRFFSGTMCLEPVLKDYRWYWRLDTDSFVLGKIKYDVFKFMEKNGYIYGYSWMSNDEPTVSEGIWELTRRYIEDRKIRPKFIHEYEKNGAWNRAYYYTNFEISSLDFWRSKPAQDYFDYLDRSGGIYKHRWGDTLIHTLSVAIFLEKTQTHRFSDVYYEHQGIYNEPAFPFRTFFRKASRKCLQIFWRKPVNLLRKIYRRAPDILFPPPPDNFFKKLSRHVRRIDLSDPVGTTRKIRRFLRRVVD